MQEGGPKAARSSVNRLWVSFRGTASLKGLIKDFKAHSVPMDTHFAAVNPHENLLSILQHIEEHADAAVVDNVIICGDFNSFFPSNSIRTLLNAKGKWV